MAEQSLGLNIRLSGEQIQTQTPQQIMSLKVLQIPLLELQEELTRELELNPVIELEAGFNEEPLGNPLTDATKAAENQTPAADSDDDSKIAELIKLSENWHDHLPGTTGSYDPDAAKRRDFMFNSQIEQPSLQDNLLEQLRLMEVSEKSKKIMEYIIGNIDDTGYFRGEMSEIENRLNISHQQLEAAFKQIHTFDPPGVGARNIKENLLIQLRRKKGNHKKLRELIEFHLDDLGRNKLPLIAKKMHLTVDDVAALYEQLRTLNPFPGSAIAASQPIFIVPDLEVELDTDGNFVIAEDNTSPTITISQKYLDMLDNPETPKDVKNYLREKILNGNQLINSLQQRQSTLRKIAEIIIDTQYDFFHKGIEHLHPMTMKEVADKLDLHETTISRASAGKYLKTPNGLFEFKFFFTGGYQSDAGEEVSSRSVKELIRDMIEEENPLKPLSDNKLSAMLETAGLKVARRTVAKYREALNIPATSLRRQHQ